MKQNKSSQKLYGKRILITRAKSQAESFVNLLKQLNAIPLEIPTIKIVPMDSYDLLASCIKRFSVYGYVIFTSSNAVKYFFDYLSVNAASASLKDKKLCVVGEKTSKALSDKGLKTDIMPAHDYKAEGLLEELSKYQLRGEHILIPSALVTRDVLAKGLLEMGAIVDEPPVYQTVIDLASREKIIELLESKQADYITFTSSSTVINLIELLGERFKPDLFDNIKIACIGPITADRLRDFKLKPDIIAEVYTIEGLIDAMLRDV